jgi:hypothetical protein
MIRDIYQKNGTSVHEKEQIKINVLNDIACYLIEHINSIETLLHTSKKLNELYCENIIKFHKDLQFTIKFAILIALGKIVSFFDKS